MITVNGISKTFAIPKKKKKEVSKPDPRERGSEFHALTDITFSAPKGKIVGLLGANGAGKTTLLRVLSTSLQPTRGTALMGGVDIVKDPLQVRRKIGFLSGKTGLYARLTPREALAFFGRMYGFSKNEIDQRIKALFEELDIHGYADKQCDLLSTVCGKRFLLPAV